MRRRDFIIRVGGATAAWPFRTQAEQITTPIVGFLRNTDAESSQQLVAAFRNGLAESGFVEGQNVTIEYRWADNHDNQLRALATDLVKRDAAVIVAAGGSVVALAAKGATQTIPIVFELGGDPVKMGLVASLNRPGNNLTGVALFANVVDQKRVEFLHDLLPQAKVIGFLVNPTNPNAEGEIKQTQQGASALGIEIKVLRANSTDDIDSVFATMRQSGISALIAMATPLFVANRDRLVALAARHAIPTIYAFPSFPKAGGLMSYGDDLADAFRQLGIYTARILNGKRPSDLPVIRPSKFQLVINLKTAKLLSVNVPPKLLALADEVIE